MVHDVDPDFPPSTMDVAVCYWQERCMASGRASFICVKCSSSATTYDSGDVSKFIGYHTVLIYPRETSLKRIDLNKKLCEVGHIFEFIQTGRPIFPLFFYHRSSSLDVPEITPLGIVHAMIAIQS